MVISDEQKDIIIGTLLGDGYLDQSGRTTRLQLKQSQEKKEYVFWLHQNLLTLCRSAPKQRQDNKQWYFGTRYFTEFTDLRKQFYENRTKIVPKNMEKILCNPISLAVWFMDDGTLDWREKDHYAYRLTTNCFSIKENQILLSVLKRNFGVNATVQTTLIRGKRYPRIHIGANGRNRFYEIISPFVSKFTCFHHKLPPKIVLNPSETRSNVNWTG